MQLNRQAYFNLWYLIAAVLGVLWLRNIWVTVAQVEPIPYSQFQQDLKEGRIKDIAISANTVQGSYKEPKPDGRTRFVTTRVDPELARDLAQYDVAFAGTVESTFLHDVLSWVAPALVFFAIWMYLAKRMGEQGGLGGHDEKEQTLNQLLVEMDGFDPSKGLILLSATNRPEILDPALLRAGRFDRQVLVDRPDKTGRVQILRVHVKKVRLAADADPEQIAALTPGFTGADLANLVNEATLIATRRGADAVALDDFTAAVERIVAGLEKKSRILNPREREIVAHHEMGHALVALALPGTDPVHKVSIIPRGVGALGYTIQRPTEDRFLMSREELENKMAVLLGGRAAEHVIYGHLSTGAADDLAKVTDIARSMVMRYGMDEKLGNLSFEDDRPLFLPAPVAGGERRYSEDTAREIDRAVRDIASAAFDRAARILTENRRVLEEGARQLLQKETLSEAQIGAIAASLVRPAPG